MHVTLIRRATHSHRRVNLCAEVWIANGVCRFWMRKQGSDGTIAGKTPGSFDLLILSVPLPQVSLIPRNS